MSQSLIFSISLYFPPPSFPPLPIQGEMLLLEYQIMLLLLRKIIYSAHNKRNCDGVEHEIIMFSQLWYVVKIPEM